MFFLFLLKIISCGVADQTTSRLSNNSQTSANGESSFNKKVTKIRVVSYDSIPLQKMAKSLFNSVDKSVQTEFHNVSSEANDQETTSVIDSENEPVPVDESSSSSSESEIEPNDGFLEFKYSDGKSAVFSLNYVRINEGPTLEDLGIEGVEFVMPQSKDQEEEKEKVF